MSNIVLSILVPSVTSRGNSFLPQILNQLETQSLPFDDVEVLALVDNKKTMLGEKRNQLIRLSQGQYVVFVDDDDKISENYVERLRSICLKEDVDVICFTVNVSLNGGPFKPCYYNKDYKCDYNEPDSYHRLPNHIMCVKRELAISTPYKNIVRGEDAAYAKDLHRKLKSHYILNEVLYEYHFNEKTTVAQREIRKNNR